MVSNFSTFGSCASRLIFNSDVNKDYKKFFKIEHSIEAVTIISLMSKPIEFEEYLLDSDNPYDNVCVMEDLSKKYLDTVQNTDLDYIIIDTYFDAFYDIIKIDENLFISDSERLEHCSFHKNIKNKVRLNIHNNFEEYFELWKDAYHRFFNTINKNKHNPIIILNCSKSVYKYCDGGKIIERPDFKQIALKTNKFRTLFDNYIMENFDVEVLSFDKNTLTDINHFFNIHPAHYENKYYQLKNQQLTEIIDRNNRLSFDDGLNVKFRKLSREKIIKENEVELLDSELSEIKNENLVLNKKIVELKEENKQLNDGLNSLLNSKSWKISKPVRDIRNHFRK